MLYAPRAKRQLYLLHLDNNTWTEGPELKFPRDGLALGVITRPSGEREVVFASGRVAGPEMPDDVSSSCADYKVTMTSEIYNIENNTLRDGKYSLYEAHHLL